MELNQLKYFAAVANHGNISRAAEELYVTQPSLSRSISRLESELKVPLFRHRKGRIELNEYGSVFLSSVNIAFSQLDSGVQTIRRMYETDQHVLSLGSNISAYLPMVLPGFFSLYPDIAIRQRDVTLRQMIEALLDRSMTLGISSEPVVHDQIRFRELGHKPYMLAVNSRNPLAASDHVPVELLEHETFIVDSSRFWLRPLQELCREHGFLPNVAFEVESMELIYTLLENNQGVAIVPMGLGCSMMRRHPEHSIRLLRIDGDLPNIIIGIASNKDIPYSQAAERFESYIVETLSKEDDMIRSMGFDFD